MMGGLWLPSNHVAAEYLPLVCCNIKGLNARICWWIRDYQREAGMGVRDFLREEETVAGLCVCRIKVGVCEYSGNTKTWEGCQGVWDLVRFEVLAG